MKNNKDNKNSKEIKDDKKIKKNQGSQELKKAIASLRAKLGPEAIRLYEENDNEYAGISTGIIGLDNLLGTKGIVPGRIYELYGPEAGGKTSISLHIIQSFQKLDQMCAFIDVEHSLDPNYAKKIGIDIKNLLIAQPNSGENAFEIIEALIKTNSVNLIVVDSVAALLPQSEIDGSIGDNNIGLQARLMSKGLRRLGGMLASSKCALIFINQLRSNISTFFGSSETTPGGRALKFYSSVRIEVRRTESIYKNNNIIGNKIRIKITKNKMNIPFKQKIFDFIYGTGVDKEKDLIDEAIEKKKIIQKGPYYYINDKLIAQGKAELFEKIKNDRALYEKLIN